ncbi:Putative tex-like protein, HTH domain superfamily [Septoria linicola]|uniref:Transcription elongation factor Spt6 n=1 Tax=Septoria linicola TaxID=215465 RepID=A0A9Q9AVM3_9PEZI|nr:putative tex-like protein, HTH domain superfamily [Septoria linicola]USW53380.1 Putative tex-like protein, HTH domain superfamily [Septoria linicola]
MADFFDTTAAVGSDEEEEEFDEETGEVISSNKQKKKSNGMDLDDSSEEDDDDDDEEAQRIREGFIVDEDEDEDLEAKAERRRERKKRRREEREQEEELDEEDLDLIGETVPEDRRRPEQQSKFKRLKRGHRDNREISELRGVENIFSDEDDGDVDMGAPRRNFGGYDDEMDGFIEQDEFPDEEGGQVDEDMGVRAPRKAGVPDFNNLKNSGLGEAELEDMLNAFGNGEEFIWALEAEKDRNEENMDPDKPLELKDVFEPSQLEERMLTDRDNEIRINDVPERFQLARAPYKDASDLSDEQIALRNAEEASWISSILFPRKRMEPNLREPFEGAVRQVLQFMNVDDLEPAFIFQNRKDYLIHSEQVPNDDPNGPPFTIKAEKLLNQTDLWDVFEQDLKYRAFAERRDAIQKNVELLKEIETDFNDEIFDDLIPLAAQLDDLQDLQDYLNFQYSLQLKDLSIAEAETNGTQKRARGTRSMWDKVRLGPAYHLVRAFGITADGVAQNAENQAVGRRRYTEDPDRSPEDIADTLIRDPDYKTGEDVLVAAKAMFVEELVMSPRMRRHMRKIYYENLVFDCYRTEKGLKQISEDHPYYEFKYLRNQEVRYFLVEKPELFLRMLKAEADGLVEVRVELRGEKRIKQELQKTIESDNFSAVADAWNALRRDVLDTAVTKMHRIIAKGVKDNLKNECENKIGGYCRDAFTQKLDQAPYKPKGMELGTSARVLALSNGAGNRGDAICWAYVDEGGVVKENGKWADLRPGKEEKYIPDGKDIANFTEVVRRRKPDVVAISGWSVETYKLYQDLKDIIRSHEIHGPTYEDPDEERDVSDPLEVLIVNDEVARLYWTSDRSAVEHPGTPPLTRYCISLARYMQDPLKQYAALKKDITSVTFDPNQQLLPEDKLRRYLDSAMVDIVNLVGVDVNEAVNDTYTANLLPYVCGLGPRKADSLLKAVAVNGGDVSQRGDLVGDVEKHLRPAMGPTVFKNSASFLYLAWDDMDDTDYLDGTRIHPEDYELARKMAADALELDEEDIKAETDENGEGAVVRRLVKEDQQDKVNDLVLEQYAKQLEDQFQQKKRATLETIRAELQNPYEELRRNFNSLTTDELFTQLTGETRDSLMDGMMISVSVKRTFPDHIEVKLDCGIDGGISETEYPEDMVRQQIEPRRMWSMHQVIQAKLSFIDRKKFTAQLTLRESEMRKPFRRNFDHGLDEWDDMQEEQDQKAAKKAIESKAGRQQRVIKHPLFRPFNSSQAIDALQSQNRGDCIIRPSSKGPDHLAVTWKVAEGVFQHIDVLELDKENEFSVGRTLKVGKASYSDLDELIVLHVQAMAKKVDEMTNDERFQNGTKEQTEQWLTTYTEANPKRSMYAFCLNRQYPGYFFLCFKAGFSAPLCHWPVKVIPQGFELRGNKYPDVRALKNGFKLIMSNMSQQNGGRR